MQFDPNNPVVKLCAEGMELEALGKTGEAHSLFQQAWDAATNDFEAFTAAHYLARNQPTQAENLHWNLIALEKARLINGDGMEQYFPSLYLNVAKAYETMGNMTDAATHYQKAADSSHHLPAGKYGDMLRMGISEGLKRTGAAPYTHPQLDNLINQWCERKELKPLALVLPAYVGNMGDENGIAKLVSAFSYLLATRCLDTKDQKTVESLVKTLHSLQT